MYQISPESPEFYIEDITENILISFPRHSVKRRQLSVMTCQFEARPHKSLI